MATKPLSAHVAHNVVPRHSGGEKHQSVEMSPRATMPERELSAWPGSNWPCAIDCAIAGVLRTGTPMSDARACGELASWRLSPVRAGGLKYAISWTSKGSRTSKTRIPLEIHPHASAVGSTGRSAEQ